MPIKALKSFVLPEAEEKALRAATAKYNVPYALARFVMAKESTNQHHTFDKKGNVSGVKTSPTGAIGYMGILPSTGADMGYSKKDLLDPVKNIEAGVRYIAWVQNFVTNPNNGLIKPEYKNLDKTTDYTMMAYNWGIGNVQKHKKNMLKMAQSNLDRSNMGWQERLFDQNRADSGQGWKERDAKQYAALSRVWGGGE